VIVTAFSCSRSTETLPMPSKFHEKSISVQNCCANRPVASLHRKGPNPAQKRSQSCTETRPVRDEPRLFVPIEFPTPHLWPTDLATAHLVHTDDVGAILVQKRPAVYHLLWHASNRLTQQELLDCWPVDGDPPDRSTLSRCLKRASEQGLIRSAGSGYRGDSYRDGLASANHTSGPATTRAKRKSKRGANAAMRLRRPRVRPAASSDKDFDPPVDGTGASSGASLTRSGVAEPKQGTHVQ
jgi:hypothetical protein